MNKLLLVEDINDIKAGEYQLQYEKDVQLNIKDQVILHNTCFANYHMHLKVKNQACLVMYNYYQISHDIKIEINVENNAKVDYYMLLLNEGKNKVTLSVVMTGNQSKVSLKVRVINKTSDSNIDIICDGLVEEDTKDNELVEDIKGFVLHQDSIKISPNLEVLTNEVIANHLVSIGSFQEAELFYLQSRGIEEKKAKSMIIKGFMMSVLSELEKEEIKMEVINIE